MTASPRSKIYVGVKGAKREVFRSTRVPTDSSHGARFTYSIGPFRTLAGAKVMAKYGNGNPHLRNVWDAEKMAANAKARYKAGKPSSYGQIDWRDIK